MHYLFYTFAFRVHQQEGQESPAPLGPGHLVLPGASAPGRPDHHQLPGGIVHFELYMKRILKELL